MSRINDLLDLIQNTNDFYLMNPARNVRSVYIQIDDLCELAMKSWLQLDTAKRQELFLLDLVNVGLVATQQHRAQVRRYFNGAIDQAGLEQGLGAMTGANQVRLNSAITTHQPLQDWSANIGNGFKDFEYVVGEVKDATPTAAKPENAELHRVLDRFVERRANRNRFFHDQNQTGLTVDNDTCLAAFTDLFWMCAYLFDQEYIEALQAKAVVRAQISIIKLKQYGTQIGVALAQYQLFLTERGTIKVGANTIGHEFCALHEDARNFLLKLQRYFENQVTERQGKAQRIEGLTRRTRDHLEKLTDLNAEIEVYKGILRECFDVVI